MIGSKTLLLDSPFKSESSGADHATIKQSINYMFPMGGVIAASTHVVSSSITFTRLFATAKIIVYKSESSGIFLLHGFWA